MRKLIGLSESVSLDPVLENLHTGLQIIRTYCHLLASVGSVAERV
jgi:hypothetical protein